MDEENIAEDEIKQLQKDMGDMVTGKRRNRGGASNDVASAKESKKDKSKSKKDKKKDRKEKKD